MFETDAKVHQTNLYRRKKVAEAEKFRAETFGRYSEASGPKLACVAIDGQFQTTVCTQRLVLC
jgi:hypothetical protein